MNFKIENAHYLNYYGTFNNARDGQLYFNMTLTDLDGQINDGNPFEYTYNQYDEGGIHDYIEQHLNEITIDLPVKSDFNGIAALDYYKLCKLSELKKDFEQYISNDVFMYKDSLYDYTDKTLQRLNAFIQKYNDLIANNSIEKSDVSQIWIDAENKEVALGYDDLIELRNIVLDKIQEAQLYYNNLKHIVNSFDNFDDVRKIYEVIWDRI